MIYLRNATQNDIDLLYIWANDTDVRKNSFNCDHIPYEEHVKWFNNIMKEDQIFQYILMNDEIPVGQIRLNIEGDSAEIGYSIASKFRNRGLGHMILQLIAEEVKNKKLEIRELIAKVKPENMPSQKLFEDEGYEKKYICYSLDIR